jgi:hypothetical protein
LNREFEKKIIIRQGGTETVCQSIFYKIKMPKHIDGAPAECGYSIFGRNNASAFLKILKNSFFCDIINLNMMILMYGGQKYGCEL